MNIIPGVNLDVRGWGRRGGVFSIKIFNFKEKVVYAEGSVLKAWIDENQVQFSRGSNNKYFLYIC